MRRLGIGLRNASHNTVLGSASWLPLYTCLIVVLNHLLSTRRTSQASFSPSRRTEVSHLPEMRVREFRHRCKSTMCNVMFISGCMRLDSTCTYTRYATIFEYRREFVHTEHYLLELRAYSRRRPQTSSELQVNGNTERTHN